MYKNLVALWRPVILCFAALSALPALAGGGGSAGPPEGVNYVSLSPPLMVNYGGPGKARFIKAELSLRAENAADTLEIMHHLPLIRDKLICILSAQTEDVISTPAGKEQLRAHALVEINKAIHIATYGETEPKHGADVKHSADDKQGDKKHGKDKKGDAKTDKKSPASSAAEHHQPSGPASDLLFNNFVVQK